MTDRAFCLLNCPSCDSAGREGSCLEFAALFREDAAASASPQDPLVFQVSGLQPTDADSELSTDIGEPFGSAREAFLPGPPPAFPRWYPSLLKPEFPSSKATSTDEVIAGQRLALAGLRLGGKKNALSPEGCGGAQPEDGAHPRRGAGGPGGSSCEQQMLPCRIYLWYLSNQNRPVVTWKQPPPPPHFWSTELASLNVDLLVNPFVLALVC